MNPIHILEKTKRYYAEWLSVDPAFLDEKSREYFLYSPEREKIPEGYNHSFDMYGYFSGRLKIISYGKKMEPHISHVQDLIHSSNSLTELASSIKDEFNNQFMHDFKYYFTKLPLKMDVSKAKQLAIQDYPAYYEFFKTMYPDSEVETWLEEYFNNIANKGCVFGYFIGEKLVSATDAPQMPYMQDDLVEIGINTLPDCRGKGYAKIVTGAMIKFLVSKQLVPIVSCAASNMASQKLIESLGFVKLADVISLTI